MRIGTNPNKSKNELVSYKCHRIIIPVYIPDSKDPYYQNLFDVLKCSLSSLFSTTSSDTTNITIINDYSNAEVTAYLDKLLAKGMIDKHVKYSKNYGKVYGILSESKASYEDFITIADFDVFYMNNWANKVFEIFESCKGVGVVSPVPAPHLTFYCNSSFFGQLFPSFKKGKVVDEKSFALFEEGINNPKIFISKDKNWKEEQFYLKSHQAIACIGSGHFIATYKADILRSLSFDKPVHKFRNGDEYYYLDEKIDRMGYFRLSTSNTFAYHLGNSIPSWVKKYVFSGNSPVKCSNYSFKKSGKTSYYFRRKLTSLKRKLSLLR